MPTIEHYLALAEPYLHEYGYGAVFFGVFVEGFGIPAPGESLIVASALLASQGKMSIVAALLVGWCAAVAGDNIGYAIGRFGGRRLVLRRGRYVGIREQHLEHVERFFRRYGGGIVVIARFFEVLRQLNGVVAGIGGMSWWRFLAFNGLGAALWVGVWGYGIYRLGRHMDVVIAMLHRVEPYAIAIAVLSLIGAVGYIFSHRRSGSNASGH